MESSHLTISQWITLDPMSARLFRQGLPRCLPIIGLSHEKDDCEMSSCDRDVFGRYALTSETLPMQLIVDSFDCISFLPDEKAVRWLPFWVSAAFYEQQCRTDPKGLISAWTGLTIIRIIEAGLLQIDLEILYHFGETCLDGREGDPEFFEALDNYAAQRHQGE